MFVSGWIFPDGVFHAAEQWWHIAKLYELKEAGHNLLQSCDVDLVFSRGDEAEIRDLVAGLGFIKICELQIDGIFLNHLQLSALQNLLLLYSLELEFQILLGSQGIIKTIDVDKILKIKNPDLIFLKTQ